MNEDLLECKKTAQSLVSSNHAPLNSGGRKKGYIEVMTELWEAKGYAHLGFKSHNLTTQAARLEKASANNTFRCNDSTDAAAGLRASRLRESWYSKEIIFKMAHKEIKVFAKLKMLIQRNRICIAY